MARKLDIATYNEKRDFTKTAEPKGRKLKGKGDSFVVQKHDATRLHWDFRLELDGVLKSWAVPRGPSLDPHDNRLAVRTEDHPLDYGTFEGIIPKGEYGGGTVMLWDRGRWIPHPDKDPRKTIEEGHLHFTLEGERMKGEWVMFRLKAKPGERAENWMLKKVTDPFASDAGEALVEEALTSVTTGRTMAEIASGAEVWESNRGAKKGGRTKRAPVAKPPAFRPPQLATLVDAVPAGSDWLFEYKYDGYRLLLATGDGAATAWTRNGKDWSDKFRSIAKAAGDLPAGCLIDGEAVALGPNRKPDFQLLQATLKDAKADLAFYAFDLIVDRGQDISKLPNLERKERLAALLKGVGGPILYGDHVLAKGEALFEAICAEGGEGIIAKKASAPYRSERAKSWLKIKCTNRQEFVIVGWQDSDKRRGFRSLHLAAREGKTLTYAGKVGTGFNTALIESLSATMAPLEQEEPPVAVPRSARRGSHWIKPQLVGEIAYTEFTSDGVLRHPSFVALREDKSADQVVREVPEHVEKPSRSSKKQEGLTTAAALGARITNPDRVIFPGDEITKGQLADYYAAIAAPIMVDAGMRPLTLIRCPQGRAKHCFFQKHDSGSMGPDVLHLPVKEKDGSVEDYLYVEKVEGLIACVQMGTIEFHGWGSRIDPLEKPDRLVFDLDPDVGLDFDAVRNGAERLRALLADLGLETFPLLSGGKGIHVVAPLDQSADWPAVKSFAERFSRAIAEKFPEEFTANIRKNQRTGRIFVDWLRNQRGATAVLPYSARAREGAPVAAPIDWSEVAKVSGGGHYSIRDVEALLERAASPLLAGWGRAKQALPDL